MTNAPRTESQDAAIQLAATPSYANILQANSNSPVRTPSPTVTADRKYNIVVYGIKESSKGTRIHARVSNDVKSVSTTIQTHTS